MENMEIRNLKEIDFATLFRAFEQAFADYDIRFGEAEVRAMLRRRGFRPELSFAAFDGERIAAFTLNGIGRYRGVPTAYDTGTGTLKAYRGRGLATEIFRHAVPRLREAGIGQYLLEVLQHNTAALAVYRRLGFGTTREFDCFRQRTECVRLELDRPEHALPCTIGPIDRQALAPAADFFDFAPSWQNDASSVARAREDLRALGACVDGRPVGFCLFDPLSGDLAQIAVDRLFRRRGIASRLLREMVAANRCEIVKVLNVESSCRSLAEFLRNRNIVPAGRQYEMVRRL